MRLTRPKFATLILAAICLAVSASPAKSQPLTHWSVVVKIESRPPGNGTARIMLVDAGGRLIEQFEGVVTPYTGRAVGINGPRRDIPNGDTPFGVYQFHGTAGGTAEDRLSPAFGTGKIYLKDWDLFGEVADAKRSLIRLHGGGSALEEPYALDQPLLPTKGCVRMKNRDVNDLIRRLKGLTPENLVQFIFMGNHAYLNALVADTTLSGRPWWPVLRIALQAASGPVNIPATHAARRIAHHSQLSIPTNQNPTPQSSASLIELINLYAEDVGPKGEQALNTLRSQIDQLVSLQNSLPADDSLRPKLAFVLCNLDHEFATNMRVLQTAITFPTQFKDSFADQVQDMISRLIDREDRRGNYEASTSLTRSLIAVAEKADGALSEGIGITLSKQLRLRSEDFFVAWADHFSTAPKKSKGLKSRVFALMRASHRLTVGEISHIRNYLNSLADYPAEFGAAVKDFSELYFQPVGRRGGRRR